MLHLIRGNYVAKNRQDLKQIGVVRTIEAGSRWKGVSHFDFVEAALEALKDLFGIIPKNEMFAVSPDNATLIGGFELHEQKGKKTTPLLLSSSNGPDETIAALGMRHSNNSQYALSWSAGGSVLCCSNGMVTGEFKDKRKHTTGLNVKEWLRESLSRLMEWIEKGRQRLAKLKDSIFKREWHERALLALARCDALPARFIPEMDRLFVQASDYPGDLPPELSAFGAGASKSSDLDPIPAWSWYNLLTWVMKKIRIPRQMQSLLTGMNCLDYLIDNPKADVDKLTAAIKPTWEFA